LNRHVLKPHIWQKKSIPERNFPFGQGSGSAGGGGNNKDRMYNQGCRQVSDFHGFGF